MSRTNQPVYAFGPFRLIPAERVLRRDGEIIPLTPKALETLLALVEHCGRVVTKEELMRRVWPDTFVEEANVAKNVYALRRALGEVDGAQEYIETVPKRGYQFVAPVARLESPGEAVAAVGPRLESVGPHTESVGPRPKEVVAPPAESVSAAGGREAPRRFIAVAASILLLSVAALLAYRYAPQTSPAVPEQAPRIAPFANSPDIEEYPSFSPDGSQVVYSRSAVDGPPGRASLYVQSVAGGAGGQPVRLTNSEAFDYSPAWSPDGRAVAFVRASEGAGAFYLVSVGGGQAGEAEGGAERKIAAAVAVNTAIQSLGWFPDGRALAVSDKLAAQEPFAVFRLSVETGEKLRLTSPGAPLVGDLQPAVSPDGKLLAFARVSALGEASLYVTALDGSRSEPRRLTFDGFSVGGPAWMPDSREIVFDAGRDGRTSLWRIPASGGTPQQVVTDSHAITSLAVAPQGHRIVYSHLAEDANVWRLSLTADAPPSAVISSPFWDAGPQLSPDGRQIAFESNRQGVNEIWVADADGGNHRRLTYLNSSVTGSPRWSPDGRHIAFDSRRDGHSDIYLVAVDGGEVRRLTTGETEEHTPSWSRDGRWVYFGSDRGGGTQIWKVSVGGGETVQVTRQGGFEGYESADGRFFYFTKGGDVPGIWRVPVGGGEETCVVRHHQAGLWRPWAVTERGIYFVTAEQPGSQGIEFFSFADGSVRCLHTTKKQIGHGTSGLAVDSGGRWLLFAQADKRGGDLFLVENVR